MTDSPNTVRITAGPLTSYTRRVPERTVRMIGSNTTEINDSRVPYVLTRDDSGAFNVPERIVPDALKAGLVRAPLTQAQRLRDVFEAIDKLDDGDMKTALKAAAIAESLKVAKLSSAA